MCKFGKHHNPMCTYTKVVVAWNDLDITEMRLVRCALTKARQEFRVPIIRPYLGKPAAVIML